MNTLLWPSLGYRDAPAAVRFLVDALGFRQASIYYGDSKHWISQAVLRWADGGTVTVHSTAPDETSMADLPGAAAFGIYLYAEDPDRLYERAIAAGATSRMEPCDNARGARSATIGDPEGVAWSFGTYRGD